MKISYDRQLERTKRNAKTEVHLRMKTAEGKTVDRSIDITNLLLHVGNNSVVAHNTETQRALLEDWIKYRGNDQHATTLTLISWSIT